MRLAAGALLVALLLGGCTPSEDAVRLERQDLAARAADTIRRDLTAIVSRLECAMDGAQDALASAGDAGDGTVFQALEALRARCDVDGLLWEGPGAGHAWAGRVVEPLAFPPPAPWKESFRVEWLTIHRGPFLFALVAGPLAVHGGLFWATAVVEEQHPEDGPERPFAQRWLEKLEIEGVRLRSPEDEGATFLVNDREGTPLLNVEIVLPGERAVSERLEQDDLGRSGLLLLGWLTVTVLVLGLLFARLGHGARGLLACGLVVIAARTALAAIDLPRRFPVLRGAFDPADFGVEDPFGWLASPADFALTALTFLLAAACFTRAVTRMRTPGPRALDALALVGGVGCAAAVCGLWIAIVELAVAQGQTDFFAVPSIVPSLPAALMLTGLVSATATAWILTVACLRVATSGSPRMSRLPWVVLPAVGASALALALAGDTGVVWAAPLLPLTSLLAFLPPSDEERTALPSRVLLVGVLATILLFPLLWTRVGMRRSLALSAALDDLLRGEATAVSGTLLDFGALASDADLLGALRAARDGPVPEGLAFEVWLDSFLAQPGAAGLVSVLDAEGRRLDEFTLTPLPRDRIPRPAPPTAGAGDVQVAIARSEGKSVRCVVGRLRLRDEDDSILGHVVFTVPDRVDLALLGSTGTAHPPQVAILTSGRVVASSDPTVSHQAGGFGPLELASLGPEEPEYAWQGDGEEGCAVWSWDRGVTVAVRQCTAGVGDAVLALARLVVVGVGLAALAAVALLLAGLRRFRRRLHHRILLSYFVISFVPLVVLGWASARDARSRHDAYLSHRLETDIGRARSDLEAMGPHVFDRASNAHLVKWAYLRGHDVLLYRDGMVTATSRPGLVEAELIPSRLPADAYRATVQDGREVVRREASLAGRPVWFGCAPVVDADGRTAATVGVPLLYEKDRVEEGFAATGSVLLAAYLLTLVLVLVGGLWAAGRLTRPLGLLAAGTRRVAAGELDVELDATGGDELGELVRAFNTMTRALKEAQARAVRAEREMAWRRMARQVAHEIKNPLTPIRLMIQQMEADVARDPDRAVEAIRRTAPVVLRQIEALGRIAADFAHFARMPRRTIEDVDVAALARDIVALHSGSAGEGVVVTGEIPSDLPRIRWDAQEIRRVLVNLVGNAVQSIRGEGRVRVRVRPERRGHREGVRVEVIDTGEGIRPEHLDRLFEPDFSTKTSGTGLGLAMVRRTLDDMAGDIAVESTPGEGSTFSAWWPVDPPPPSPETST